MTGRYPTLTGVTEDDMKLPREEVGIAQVFEHHGYLNQYVGRWHLDGLTPNSQVDPGWANA
jgi:arylsulfatase A-like enzyme